MSKRHPHIKGNHEEGHEHGPMAIHPMHRPGAHHAFGGHHGQNRAGEESPAHEAAESPAFEAGEHATGAPAYLAKDENKGREEGESVSDAETTGDRAHLTPNAGAA